MGRHNREAPRFVGTAAAGVARLIAPAGLSGPNWANYTSGVRRRLEGRLGGVTLFIVVAVAYYAGSRVAFELLQVADLGAVFFAPSGVMVGTLVLCPPRRWWIVITAGALAEAVIDVHLSSYRWWEVVGFVAANMIETALIAALVLWRLDRRPDLSRRVDLTVFLTATAIGTAIGASIGAWTIQASGSTAWWPSFYQWWLGDGLGVLTVGTTIVATAGTPDRRTLRSPEGAAVTLAIALLSVAVYAGTDLPVGFLVLVAVIPAAARFGTQAVTMLFAVVTAIVIVLATSGDLLTGNLSEATALVIFKLQFVAFISAGLYVAAESSEREHAQQAAAREHQTVEELQRALLPASKITGGWFHADGVYQAASDHRGVGGDWYDVILLPDGRLLIRVGDVVGNGTAAVVVMGRLRFLAAGLASLYPTPGELLDELDRQARHIDGAAGTTLWISVVDPERNILLYSSAGHLPPLHIDDDQSIWLDGGRSVPLALPLTGLTNRPTATVPLSETTRLVLYTDGAVERPGETIDLGMQRLRRCLDTTNTLAELLNAAKDPTARDDAVLLKIVLTPRQPSELYNSAQVDGRCKTAVAPIA